ncbi:hypothetical protein [Treponema socranskii]|uniref:hypothetical protein n=1 Tax=Treponema socranskii TaxID=53419 RepID=UPI003D8A9FE4
MKVHIAYTHKDNGSGVWLDKNGKELTSDYCKGNEVYVTDKDGKEVQTKARFLQYTGKVLRDKDGQLLDDDIYKGGVILRFRNGRLDGEGEPAVETEDCHIEYWDKGELKEVVSDYMNHKEKWQNNIVQEVRIDKES